MTGKRTENKNDGGKRSRSDAYSEQCTCSLQQSTVSQDHAKSCPLYRQRGSGVSVLRGSRPNARVTWWSASGRSGGF
ncbi:MAG: hypothetical protein H0U76_01445 [Ktedonobacteraceae bacterium]|nr:hypothetical protein [Ktedonobacteraceae bacterium]